MLRTSGERWAIGKMLLPRKSKFGLVPCGDWRYNRNMFKSRIYLSVLIVFCFAFLAGCSVPGSSNPPAIDDSVTITGTVSAPIVANQGLLGAAGQSNDATAFARFASGSTLKVNGRVAEFSLNDTTRELRVEKISPAAAYELELRRGDFSLIAFVPHSGRQISLLYGLSLRSTAEWYLRAAFGSSQKFSIDQFAEYQVNSGLIDKLVGSLQTELGKSGLASAAWRLAASNGASTLVKDQELADVMQRAGNAFSYNGTFSGNVVYWRLDGSGKPVMEVQAAVVMTCSTSGNSVNGSFNIEPQSTKPIENYTVTSPPSTVAFAFTGTLSGSYLRFTRRAANDGSPLSGKDLDSWFIFPVKDGLAVQCDNLDLAYRTGIQTRAGDFVLRKK